MPTPGLLAAGRRFPRLVGYVAANAAGSALLTALAVYFLAPRMEALAGFLPLSPDAGLAVATAVLFPVSNLLFLLVLTPAGNLLGRLGRDVAGVRERLQALQEVSQVLAPQLQGVNEETERAAKAIAGEAREVEKDVGDLGNQIDRASAQGHQMQSRFQASTAALDRVEDFLQRLLEQWEEADAYNQRLLEALQGLGEVVDTIKGVSKQTDVLALNAAIEAANAGEHGKGFAVVADEVRDMASRITDSTETVEGKIADIQGRARMRREDETGERLLREGRSAIEALRDGFEGLSADYDELQRHHTEILESIRQANEDIRQRISVLLSSIQFQDVTRQRVDQVIEALGKQESQLGYLESWLRAPENGLRGEALEARTLYRDYVMASQRRAHRDRGVQEGEPEENPALAVDGPRVELF